MTPRSNLLVRARTFPFLHRWLAVLGGLAVGGTLAAAAPAAEIVRYPEASAPGLARAVKVVDAPLAHTTTMFGWDAQRRIAGDARAQAAQALRHLDAALAAVGAGADTVVKLNVYLRDEADAAAADAAIAEKHGRHPVAVSWVTSDLPDAAARVGIDAVAMARGSHPRVHVASIQGLASPPAGAHVAVLPAGRRIYVSGQAERDGGLGPSTRKTMVSLGQTLDWLKVRRSDVVQVKAFIKPMGEVAAAASEIAAFFAGGPVPPCVFVEWAHPSTPAEIEMIVAGGAGTGIAEGVEFLTPPGMVASPRFARIAIVDPAHPLIFISGLYGEGGGRREWLDIYSQLGDILWETGSSMRHQVKGTYYGRTPEARRLHNEVRGVFFDPARPPGSSGMLTRGVGRAGRDSTIDMIAIPVPTGK